MQKSFWLTLCGIAFAGIAWGQIKKQFTVENTQACENIRLHLKANSGNCYIKPSQNPEILNVFSNQDASSYSHNYRKEIKGKTCEVYLNVEETNSEGIGRTISTRMFGSEKSGSNKLWKIYLTESKPYNLELDYGIGNAHIDLSGLAIKKLKINTGSADVNVGYSALGNKVDMDTFSVKVDLGSLNIKNLNLSKTHYMIADVGFGNMTLDFSSTPLVSNTIKGSVGAGNLTIILPSDETPVLVKVHDSWLCSVKVPASLKKISENTFANASYKKDAKNSLSFDLDVSMGSIVFREPAK
ncbi:hypothetical protein [Chryseosolibacter indicus]|uniref:Adhesin domain-containing protein n=1 Tax=Chryseosolibacter indicus TaxID=2782351 RepID=A0ABS5VUF9_9BACT|nr:hypothetical protein [Chryseosolibacter indicus]MBT1704678.1 hypothetical protein [Chryseosolibacter indicus]